METKFLTREEVQKYLGIGKTAFYEHYAKTLPGYVIGRRIKYKIEDVDRAIRKIWRERKTWKNYQ